MGTQRPRITGMRAVRMYFRVVVWTRLSCVIVEEVAAVLVDTTHSFPVC